MTPDERLKELNEELSKGRIVESRLHANGEHVEGLCEVSGTIYIDPRSAVVSTLLHELIHRRWPSWSEARVRREEERLIVNMSSADIGRWYRQYQKVKTTRQKTKTVTP